MRNGRIGLMATALASLMAGAGCSSSTSNPGGAGGGTGGSASGTGGTAGGTGGGTGSSVTGVSGTKTIGSLSAAEATQLCNDTYGYFGTAIPHATACKWNGLYRAASSSSMTTQQLQTGCSLAENSCLQSDAGAFTNNGCGDVPKNCTLTVAQYATCIADEVTEFLQTVNGFPGCTTVTMAGTSPILNALAGGNPPASCMPFADTCAALFVPNPLTPN